jgi:hypothetical protein
MINKHKQKGAETVEFAIVALLLFAVLFVIIEFSRALFVWNALTEATRRGARMAVVCPYQSPIPAKVTIFDVRNGSLDSSPIIGGLELDMVNVSYFKDDGVTPTADQTLIRFAQVSITGYQHKLFIPLWGSTITAPEFTTTLPTESLGAVPTLPDKAQQPTNCNF